MRSFIAVGLIGLVAILPGRTGLAQALELECDRSVQALAGASGYQKRTGDTRCEGVFELPVSATGLELVSATMGPIDFDAQQHKHAIIAVPQLPDGTTEAVVIRVIGLPLGLHYRLDAQAAPGSTLRWPLGEVVEPWRLKSSDLGAFGRLADEERAAIVPLSISPQERSSRAASIELLLRSPLDLERIWWRELRDDGASDYQELASDTYGGEVIRFTVPDGAGNNVQLEFAARLARGGQHRSLSVTLVRPR